MYPRLWYGILVVWFSATRCAVSRAASLALLRFGPWGWGPPFAVRLYAVSYMHVVASLRSKSEATRENVVGLRVPLPLPRPLPVLPGSQLSVSFSVIGPGRRVPLTKW